MLSHKEHHKEYHKEYMQKFRDNGRKNWRKTKRAKYNAIKYAKSMVDNFNRLQEWNIKDINEILKMDKPDLELSKLLGRSVKAIQVKRSKLKSKLWGIPENV